MDKRINIEDLQQRTDLKIEKQGLDEIKIEDLEEAVEAVEISDTDEHFDEVSVLDKKEDVV